MSDKPTVVEALSAVMGEVQAVGKDSRNTQQNFNFRGIDAVVNAVGPALRKHGVVVVPTGAAWEAERYQTKGGAQMRGVTLTVSFRFYGPAGDSIDASACGESSDAGDKAMPKAHSVAYRTLLLQALCIPTDESDPDADSHERAAKPAVAAAPLAETDDTPATRTPPDDGGDPAKVILTFGKHKDKRIGDVPRDYLIWWTGQAQPTSQPAKRAWAAATIYLRDTAEAA